MREIKFRVWSERVNKMFYPKDNSITISNGKLEEIKFKINGGESILFGKFLDIHKPILMQYTNLKDKGGKEIYEGDILQFDSTDLKTKKLQHKFNGIVEYKYCRYCISHKDIPYNIYDIGNHIKVIGNIYENPELLKE